MHAADISGGRVVALSYGGFLLIGIINTMLGPILPTLSGRWQLNDAQAGTLLLAQPVGGMLGSAFSGVLIGRFGFKPVLTLGFAVMAAAAACLGFGNWYVGMISVFGSGIALGLTIPATSLLCAELNPHRRAAALNLLNLFWGVGAVIGPLLIAFVARLSSVSVALVTLAVLIALMAVSLAFNSGTAPDRVSEDPVVSSGLTQRTRISSYMLLTMALVFVDVGTESSMGGWVTSYVQRLTQSGLSAYLAPSMFWAGLLTVRATAPLILRVLSEVKLILIGIVLTLFGLLVILVSNRVEAILGSIALTGAGLGPIFPTTLALFYKYLGVDARRFTGILFILAGLGSATFPWLVGAVATHLKGLRAGLVVPMLAGLIMIALQAAIILSLRDRKPEI